jgi:hypothetical protein
MRRLSYTAYVLLTAAIAALPVLSVSAQDIGDIDEPGDVVIPVLWSIGAILVGGLILAVFQMYKRHYGGFDNPEWVAPIGAIYSRDLPQDEEVIHGHDTEDATGGAVEPAALDTSHEIRDREAFPPQDPEEQKREAIETGESDVPPPDSEAEIKDAEHH